MIATVMPTTLQGFFNNAWQHAVVEKQPRCTDEGGFKCLYRDGSGNACLIGASIPATLYDEDMEGDSIGSVLEVMNVELEFFTALTNLQYCHDDYVYCGDGSTYEVFVERKLRQFAKDNKLRIPRAAKKT